MYITLSETAEELRANAASHGWDLSGIHMQELQPAENLRPEEQYTLFHPSEIELGDLSRNVFEAVEKFKPARAVLDSVSDMRLLARDSLRYRRQILGLEAVLRRARLHAAAAERDRRQRYRCAHSEPRARRHPAGTIGSRLRHRAPAARNLQSCAAWRTSADSTISGLRRGAFASSRDWRTGGRVALSRRKTLKSGLPPLDALLDNGVPMGTCTLILGPSGVGKSTLSAHYLASAARKGHSLRGVSLRRTTRRPSSTAATRSACDLSKYAKSGLLKIAKVEPGSMSPGEFSHSVRKAVEDDKVRVVLIDSLTGYLTAIPESARGGRAPARAHVVSGELRRRHVPHGCAAGHARAEHDVAHRRQLHRRHDVHDALLRGRRTRSQGPLRPEEAHGAARNRPSARLASRTMRSGSASRSWTFRGVLTGVPEYTRHRR